MPEPVSRTILWSEEHVVKPDPQPRVSTDREAGALTGRVGEVYLGTQGDPLDAQWDMVCAVVGALVVQWLFRRAHDRHLAHTDDTTDTSWSRGIRRGLLGYPERRLPPARGRTTASGH